MNSVKREQFTLRLTEGLSKTLTDEARRLGISTNSLIVIILSKGVEEFSQSKKGGVR